MKTIKNEVNRISETGYTIDAKWLLKEMLDYLEEFDDGERPSLNIIDHPTEGVTVAYTNDWQQDVMDHTGISIEELMDTYNTIVEYDEIEVAEMLYGILPIMNILIILGNY